MVTYNRNKKREEMIGYPAFKSDRSKKKGGTAKEIRKERRDQPRLFERGTPRKHSVSVVDIRGDKGKHKNRLEIVSHEGN